ncbi:MAG: prepilin-type N-terminal cleavage/methylation domain-containing protein [Patescibacteria group bacterium]
MTNKLPISKFQTSNPGFTLIELLIVIGIVVLLAAIFLPIGLNFYQIQVLNQTNDQVIWLLKQARSSALSQKNNSAFGLYYNNQQLTLYQGASYEARQVDFDVNYKIPSSVKIEGLSDINFSLAQGLPGQTGTIILSSNQITKTITLNSIGLIDY